MNFKNFHSTNSKIEEAIQDIISQLKGTTPELLVCFASSGYDISSLSKSLSSAFPGLSIIGCSTSGELSSGKMTDGGISGLAFMKDSLENYRIEVIQNLKENLSTGLKSAFESFDNHFKTSMSEVDGTKHVGLLLIDGLTGIEEELNEKIGDLTGITFIGGSAGDDLKFVQTFVFANGKAYNNAAILVVLKPVGQFSFLKTQSFKPTDKILKVTEVNEKNREVIQINNMPADLAYANALGVDVSELSSQAFRNPVGLMFGEEPFVRSPRVVENGSIKFYCAVKKGTDLRLLNSTDIIADTKRDLNNKIKELGGVSGILNFNCILRTLDLKQQNRTQEYANIFEAIPMAGFSTYGESYIGHMNQTATMLLLK